MIATALLAFLAGLALGVSAGVLAGVERERERRRALWRRRVPRIRPRKERPLLAPEARYTIAHVLNARGKRVGVLAVRGSMYERH